MKTSIRIQLVILAALFHAAFNAQAQTVISGPNITTSTWSPAGNPYVVAANCTVPSGNTLTIQPGTIVWMGEGMSLTCNGRIQAAGTSGQRITFQAISGGGDWNTILVNNTVGTNQFEFCDFSDCTDPLDFAAPATTKSCIALSPMPPQRSISAIIASTTLCFATFKM